MTKFMVPEGLRYGCIRCGRCCEDFWELPVDKESMERIRSLQVFAPEEERGREALFVKSDYDPELMAMRKCEGKCVFLDEDTLCILEKRFDYETKPENCKAFPFHFLETPSGVFVGVSFSCLSVLQEKGELLSEIPQEELEREYARGVRVFRLGKEVRIAHNIFCSWEEYLLLEQTLQGLLNDPEHSLEENLIAGKFFLDMLVDFLRTGSRRFTPSVLIEEYVKRMEAGPHRERLYRLAGKPLASPLLQRLFMGMIISFRNTLRPVSGRVALISFLIRQYLRNLLRLGGISLLPLSRAFPYRAFRNVRFDADQPQLNYQLRRYLNHLMFRKDLIRGVELVEGYGFLLLYYCVIKWYAVGSSWLADKAEVDEEELLEAIRLVEKYYCLHTAFYTIFSRHPLLEGTLKGFFGKKKYAATIVGLPV